MEEQRYDVVVIGAGPAGENVADRVIQGGLSAVIVESELVGGECSYWACIPSKVLLRGPAVVAAAQRVDGARQAVTGSLDVAATLARRTSFTHNWDDASQVKWLEGAHIPLVRGRARLVGVRQVEVGTTRIEARHAVVIATGTSAAVPPIPGLKEASPWTSHEITAATRVPKRLAILGGGVVACEMATAWKALGCEAVVMIVRGRVLDRLEPFVGDLMAACLRDRGVDVRLKTEVKSVSRHESVTIQLSNGSIECDEFVVATGRRPNTDDIGLEHVGLAPCSWLEVDDTTRVRAISDGWLYAVGDANHRALLTHMGKYQARICGDVIVARAKGVIKEPPAAWSRYAATADTRAVPQVIFTDPEVAAVGLTDAEARRQGLEVRTVYYDLGDVAGASIEADGYKGRACMVVDVRRQVVVGATLVGQGVGELIHAATIAIAGEVPIDRLWHAVPCFPTISEIWLRLLEALGR